MRNREILHLHVFGTVPALGVALLILTAVVVNKPNHALSRVLDGVAVVSFEILFIGLLVGAYHRALSLCCEVSAAGAPGASPMAFVLPHLLVELVALELIFGQLVMVTTDDPSVGRVGIVIGVVFRAGALIVAARILRSFQHLLTYVGKWPSKEGRVRAMHSAIWHFTQHVVAMTVVVFALSGYILAIRESYDERLRICVVKNVSPESRAACAEMERRIGL